MDSKFCQFHEIFSLSLLNKNIIDKHRLDRKWILHPSAETISDLTSVSQCYIVHSYNKVAYFHGTSKKVYKNNIPLLQ